MPGAWDTSSYGDKTEERFFFLKHKNVCRDRMGYSLHLIQKILHFHNNQKITIKARTSNKITSLFKIKPQGPVVENRRDLPRWWIWQKRQASYTWSIQGTELVRQTTATGDRKTSSVTGLMMMMFIFYSLKHTMWIWTKKTNNRMHSSLPGIFPCISSGAYHSINCLQ